MARRISARNRRKIRPIERWMMRSPHPFTRCYKANVKRFGSARAKRICAANKDRAMGTTRWRSGRRKRR